MIDVQPTIASLDEVRRRAMQLFRAGQTLNEVIVDCLFQNEDVTDQMVDRWFAEFQVAEALCCRIS